MLQKADNHTFQISLNIAKPYPPILRKESYPASPGNKVEIERHIHEILNLGVLGNTGEKEEADTTTPVIIAWNNEKFGLRGNFRSLNTYTVSERYPLPRIDQAMKN